MENGAPFGAPFFMCNLASRRSVWRIRRCGADRAWISAVLAAPRQSVTSDMICQPAKTYPSVRTTIPATTAQPNGLRVLRYFDIARSELFSAGKYKHKTFLVALIFEKHRRSSLVRYLPKQTPFVRGTLSTVPSLARIRRVRTTHSATVWRQTGGFPRALKQPQAGWRSSIAAQ
jgi:hypothetical protein